MKEKVLGSLIGAATGDAMGAATEMRTTQQIIERFGGPITTFVKPPSDVFARGNQPGEVTDDFSMAYLTCREMLKTDFENYDQAAKDALIIWSEDERYFEQFVGPTSRAAIDRFKGKKTEATKLDWLFADNSKATNGAAMKMSPISLFALGDVDKAIDIAVKIASVTHDNNLSVSAAAAVAAATNVALHENVTLKQIVDAAIYGAVKGDEIGRKNYKTLAGPSIVKRVKLAISIAINSKTKEEAMQELSDVIGNSAMAYETLPIAIGIIVACDGELMDSIIMAVNIGYDTDSIATIVGGILGAYHGASRFPDDYLGIINKVNKYDLEKLSELIVEGGKYD